MTLVSEVDMIVFSRRDASKAEGVSRSNVRALGADRESRGGIGVSDEE